MRLIMKYYSVLSNKRTIYLYIEYSYEDTRLHKNKILRYQNYDVELHQIKNNKKERNLSYVITRALTSSKSFLLVVFRSLLNLLRVLFAGINN